MKVPTANQEAERETVEAFIRRFFRSSGSKKYKLIRFLSRTGVALCPSAAGTLVKRRFTCRFGKNLRSVE